MGDSVIAFVFYLFSAIIVASAIAVVTLRNLIHAALFLVVTFIGVAVMYILLHAEFLAAVQVLVYAGAVAIIIAFGVMLTRRLNIDETSLFNRQKGMAALVSAGLFAIMAYMFSKTNWNIQEPVVGVDLSAGISKLMFVDYVIAFEAIAILLLIAMVGAIVIAKEVNNTK